MAENEIQLEFLTCGVCASRGVVNGKKCHQCDGEGIVAYLAGNVLHWTKPVDEEHIQAGKVEKVLDYIVFTILGIIGIGGILSAFYSFYLVSFSDIFSISGWNVADIAKTTSRGLFLWLFWVSLLFDLLLIYLISRRKESSKQVLEKTYEVSKGLAQLPPAPMDWAAVEKIKGKNQIEISQSFDRESISSVNKAFELAKKYEHDEVLSVDIFLSLMFHSKKANHVFNRLDVDFKDLGKKFASLLSKIPKGKTTDPIFTESSKMILFKAYKEAYISKEPHVGDLELLLSVFKSDKKIQEVLYDSGITLDKFVNTVLWLRINEFLRNRYSRYQRIGSTKSKSGLDRAMTAIQTKMLNSFSNDLTQLAKAGQLDICVDRDKEFNDLFRLLEGGAAGVILLGQPGVGKTAIVDGLAEKMLADDVPELLKDKRLVRLNISALVAGVSSSQAQERLLIAFSEIVQSKNVVLVIENIHELVGISASSQDTMDLSSVLADALSKRAFICIATEDESNYIKYLENSSLGNVLQRVEVPEPDTNQAIQIIEGTIGYIEGRNGVFFSYDALEKAVTLSSRYIHKDQLPKKAIEILEEVAVMVKNMPRDDKVVKGEDVAQLLSEKLNMPLTEIGGDESEKLMNLEKVIHSRVIGQDEAVDAVSSSLRRARAELRDAKRPIANFLFLGPTGVGKTELAKTIAEVYFNSEENMIRLDMSEYQEVGSIDRMIGTAQNPSGYLTEAIRNNPYTLLLLDELEKAHPDILNIFLQVFDDGRLTDASGRTIDFTNTIIIATSNAGTQQIQDGITGGKTLDDIKTQLLEKELLTYFRPEFINRFDNVIVFKPLELDQVTKIAKLMLLKVSKRLESKGIKFQASDEAIAELAQKGFDPLYGARPLRRVIQDTVDDALAKYLIQGKIDRRDIAILEPGGTIRIEKAGEI